MNDAAPDGSRARFCNRADIVIVRDIAGSYFRQSPLHLAFSWWDVAIYFTSLFLYLSFFTSTLLNLLSAPINFMWDDAYG